MAKAEKNKMKKNAIVSYNKIDNELKLALIQKYPEGYGNYVIRYPKPNGECFFAVPLETKDVNYLIKVEVKIDNLISEDDFDKQFGEIDVDSKAIGEVEEVDDSDDADDDDNAEEQSDADDDDDE